MYRINKTFFLVKTLGKIDHLIPINCLYIKQVTLCYAQTGACAFLLQTI